MNLTNCLAVPGILLLVFLQQTEGNPVVLNGKSKPPNCPYGRCFIDHCARICNCVPPEGNISCHKNSYQVKCDQPTEGAKDNKCPLGETYRSDNWPPHFLCFCNKDESQTYECFDLSEKRPADAQLLSRIRST